MIASLDAWRKSVGPILGSVLSFFCVFQIINPLATWLSPDYSLFLRRGVGGVFVLLITVFLCCCFASIQPRTLLQRLRSHLSWPATAPGWRLFLLFFFWFALAHLILLSIYLLADAATFDTTALPLLLRRWPVLLVGFIATLFLAWSEELIFRGLLFDHFRQFHTLWPSAIASSCIFSLAHNLRAPWTLLTSEWRLGLGLFLLGMTLTIIAQWQRSLAASAGAHAGLVFIKVVLRKVPLVVIPANAGLLFPTDLRTSLLTLEVLLVAIVAFFACFSRKKI